MSETSRRLILDAARVVAKWNLRFGRDPGERLLIVLATLKASREQVRQEVGDQAP